MSTRPIASLTVSRKVDGAWVNYSVLSIWATEHSGLYSISADRGSDKYPPLGLVDAIKAFASGARMSVRVTSQAQSGGGRGPSHDDRRRDDDFGGGDPDIPFSPHQKRGSW